MRRADRLFAIVQQLRGGRRTTAARLAETLEVSARTIYRDIADLIGNGVPIEGEAGFGYVMEEGYLLPPLMLRDEELTALVTGMRMLRAWGGAAQARAAEEAMAKILDVVPERARARAKAVPIHAMFADIFHNLDRGLIDAIEAAVLAGNRLHLEYVDKKGAASTRVIRPLGLWYWGQAWTVVGWCELRDDFRMFRLDRIEQMEEGAAFRPEAGRRLRDFFAVMEAQGVSVPPMAGV